MSLNSLLVHDVTVIRAGVTTDRHHNVNKDWDNPTETDTKAWVFQQNRGEVRDNGREAQLADWVAFLPAGTDILGGDRLQWGSVVFEVDGPPRPAWTPRGEHHIEAALRNVSG